MQSLDSLHLMGTCVPMVIYQVFHNRWILFSILGIMGHLFIIHPAIMHHVASCTDLENTVNSVFEAIKNRTIRSNINYEYPLQDAVKAHIGLAGGNIQGATVLIS